MFPCFSIFLFSNIILIAQVENVENVLVAGVPLLLLWAMGGSHPIPFVCVRPSKTHRETSQHGHRHAHNQYLYQTNGTPRKIYLLFLDDDANPDVGEDDGAMMLTTEMREEENRVNYFLRL